MLTTLLPFAVIAICAAAAYVYNNRKRTFRLWQRRFDSQPFLKITMVKFFIFDICSGIYSHMKQKVAFYLREHFDVQLLTL